MKDRAYEIGRDRKYHEYQRELASVVYTFFDKKTGPRSECKLTTTWRITQTNN